MNWKKLKKETQWDDIGAWLLANLARGIYSPEAVIREYVQNARDSYGSLKELPADASIKISVDKKSITIHDNGIGMDEEALDKAKRIAFSTKAGMEVMAGFRGIGIWAGFEACNALVVETTKKDSNKRYKLHIDFAQILKHVDKPINIKQLLDNRFRIEESSAPPEEHYTRVTLSNICDDYASLLSEDELRRIASQILPARLDPNFEHHEDVSNYLSQMPSYHEYPIKVNGTEVFREFPSGLRGPYFETLSADDGTELARVWFMNQKDVINIKGFQFRTFRVRSKNIAVGPMGLYSVEDGTPFGCDKLTNTALLRWHVGEVHITSSKVRPDTPRSALELDSTSRVLIAKLRDFYSDRIQQSYALSQTDLYRKAIEFANRKLDNNETTISDVQACIETLETTSTAGRLPEKDGQKAKIAKFVRAELEATKAAKTEALTKLRKFLKANGVPTKPKEAKKKTKPAEPKRTKTTSAKLNASPKSQLDSEKLLSDILFAVEDTIQDENVLPYVSKAIQDVFVAHGLLSVNAK